MHDMAFRVAIASALAAALTVSVAAPASAESTASTASTTAAPVKVGALLMSSDGRRLGRIDDIETATDGTAVAELFSSNGIILRVPVSSIAAGTGRNLMTSMSYTDVTRPK